MLHRIGPVPLGVALFASTAAGQVTLDRFYPAVVGKGDTIVSAEGKFPSWPCEVRCDRDDIQISPAEESGKLSVRVGDAVAPGIAWIRLLDKQSATQLVPLLIEPVAVTLEHEPNNQFSEAGRVELPGVATGRLQKGGDVDTFIVSLKQGDRFVASLVANQILASPMDAVMQIVDLRGNVLAQSDDVCGLDPQLIYQTEVDAELAIRIFAFPSTADSTIGFAGASTFLYALRMTAGPFQDHVAPIVMGSEDQAASSVGWNLPADGQLNRRGATSISPAVWYPAVGLGWSWRPDIDDDALLVGESGEPQTPAIAQSLPAVFAGTIHEARQVDRLRFPVAAGKKYVARSQSRSAGFLLDSVLRVIDVNSGAEIVRKDDVSRTDFDTVAEFTAKADAQYELQVSDAVDAFSPRHCYSVRVGEAIPEVRLSVAADHYVLPAAGSLEIPVTLTRIEGFAEKVRVSATGLPDGVTVVDAVSEAKGETAKSVQLKLSASENVAFQGNIRIEGNRLDASGKPTGSKQIATFTLRSAIDLADIWLTVSPRK